MPSNFYARYAPPPAEDINPRPTKKNKTDIVESIEILAKGRHEYVEFDPQSESAEPTNGAGAKRQKGSKKKEKQLSGRGDSVDRSNPEVGAEDKHQSIRKKYKQASKKSQEISGESPPAIASDGENDLEVIQPVGLQPLPQPKEFRDGPKSTISALPDWMVTPVYASKRLPFTELGLSPELSECLSQAGYKTAFPVQTTLLPMLMKRDIWGSCDICVAASTGSGKTFAYTLPIIEALKDKPVVRLRALIIVPTRELVKQVENVFRLTRSSLKVGTAVGSKSLKEERKKLIEVDQIYNPEAYEQIYGQNQARNKQMHEKDSSSEENTDDELPLQDYIIQRSSKIDVLICTPGRLVEHLRTTKGFSLEHIQWLVIDEADRLLDQSFQQWIDIVIPQLERKAFQNESNRFRWRSRMLMPYQIVRKIVLSATMTRDYNKLLALELKNPKLVAIERIDQDQQDGQSAKDLALEPMLSTIPQRLVEVAVTVKDAAEKPLHLIQLIEASPHMPIIGINDSIRSHLPKEYDTVHGSSESPSNVSVSADSSDSSGSASDTQSNSSGANTSSSTEAPHSTRSEDSSSFTDSGRSRLVDRSKAMNHGFLVFVNTNENALRLYRLLVLLRPSWSNRVLPLTKSIGTSIGRKSLAAFKQKQVDILVATDLASRGLDLENLAEVVNYDMPKSLTVYIHRVGRTARAGRAGIASTLVAHHEARWFWKEIGRSIGVERTQKVSRKELPDIAGDDRNVYEKALEALGRETMGAN